MFCLGRAPWHKPCFGRVWKLEEVRKLSQQCHIRLLLVVEKSMHVAIHWNKRVWKRLILVFFVVRDSDGVISSHECLGKDRPLKIIVWRYSTFECQVVSRTLVLMMLCSYFLKHPWLHYPSINNKVDDDDIFVFLFSGGIFEWLFRRTRTYFPKSDIRIPF